MSGGTEPVARLRHRATMTLAVADTVPHVDPTWPGFRDMPPVFAAAMMIGCIEQTCVEALRPCLGTGQGTVGTRVEVSHVVATPRGMIVTADVELTTVDRRTLHSTVRYHDDAGLVGEGTHECTIIDTAAFIGRVEAKAAMHGLAADKANA